MALARRSSRSDVGIVWAACKLHQWLAGIRSYKAVSRVSGDGRRATGKPPPATSRTQSPGLRTRRRGAVTSTDPRAVGSCGMTNGPPVMSSSTGYTCAWLCSARSGGARECDIRRLTTGVPHDALYCWCWRVVWAAWGPL